MKAMYIYGRHAVEEALISAPHIIRKVFLAPKGVDPKLKKLVRDAGVSVELLDPGRASSFVEKNAPHQGVVARIASEGLMTPFIDFEKNFSPNSDTLLVLFGGITDPHNVGALIRSAAAFGAAAVLMPVHKQSPITPAVIKASAGMAFRIPLVSVANAQQALSMLKEKGVIVYGLEGTAKKPVVAEKFDAPALLVLGNEGEGIPGYAKALCDQFLSIPMHHACESLNVASAGAVALYAWSIRHPKAVSRN
jgi:23S rRNA (guanosine2251-2'-O)-methyltransferase